MKRNRVLYPLLTLAAAALLPACASGPPTASELKCPFFAPNVRVRYGDSYLEVDALKKVKPGCPLVFRLQPKSTRGPNGQDYDNVTVTIEGTGKPDGALWIDFSGTAAGTPNQKFSRSSPPDQEEGTYYYFVAVEDVGELDPRVEVEK